MRRPGVTRLLASLLLLALAFAVLQLTAFLKAVHKAKAPRAFEAEDIATRKADAFDIGKHFELCSAKRSLLHSSDLIRHRN
jgi:hypothetical protein